MKYFQNKQSKFYIILIRFSLLSYPNQFYLWVKCNNLDTTCYEFFLQNKLLTYDGVKFGSDNSHVRMNILLDDSTFNLFIEKLKIFN
jgi:hypothetical protein